MRSTAGPLSDPEPTPERAVAAPRPLFNIDPGWLFILAGLALCVAGVLIPAKRDLFALRTQLESLRERERLGSERLRLHARFLGDLDESDASLTRRLAASQLNVVPSGDVPVVLASSRDAALTDWIDARAAEVADDARAAPQEWPDTALTRLAIGPQRLWLLGGGVLAVFVGLMLGPSSRSHRSAAASTIREVEAGDSDPFVAGLPVVETHGAIALQEPRLDLEFDHDPVSCLVIEPAASPEEAHEASESDDACDVIVVDELDAAVDDEVCETADSVEYTAEDEVVCEIVTAAAFAARAEASDLDHAATPEPAAIEEESAATTEPLDRRCAAD